jgi:hypothetical protein
MSTQPTELSSRREAWLPLILGACAIAMSVIYELQRSSLLVPHSLERFVQHHLDGLGIAALCLAVAGLVSGLYLGRGGRRHGILLWGILASIAGTLAQLLLPL